MEFWQHLLPQLPAYALVAGRASGLFFLAPIFGNTKAPATVRIFFALMVAFLVFPFVPFKNTDIPTNTVMYMLIFIQELMIGMIYGWTSEMLFEGMVLAGQFIGLQMGFAQANLLNPMSEVQRPLLSEIYFLIGIFVFFSVDGHHILVMAFQKSFAAIPLGHFVFNGLILDRIFFMFSQIFLIGLIIAIPICSVLTLIDLIMGLVGRSAPQMNIMILGFAVKIYIGMLTLIISLPFTYSYVHDLLEQLLGQLVVLF